MVSPRPHGTTGALFLALRLLYDTHPLQGLRHGTRPRVPNDAPRARSLKMSMTARSIGSSVMGKPVSVVGGSTLKKSG